MKVVCLAPVPVASLPWRLGEGPWVLTVVCKLTLLLEPGDAVLAKRHDPIYDRDKFDGDNLGEALYAPNDLVPSRPLVDVMLVGDAYAPRGGGKVKSLTARIALQTIDKKIHIEAAEGADGFSVASLDYERARPSSSANGSPASHRLVASGDALVAGFGPLAPHWPERHELLRGDKEPDPVEPGQTCELPKDFNLKFFNAAPPDQQLPELPPNATLVLENLHPEHALLQTRLPNVAPQIFVERAKGRREEQPAEISAVWIDTRRSLMSVSWHSHVRLDDLDEPGKVLVAVAGPGRRLNAGGLSQLLGSLGGPTLEDPEKELRDEPTSDDEPDPNHRTQSMKRKAEQRKPPPLPVREDTMTSILQRVALDGNDRISERTADGIPGPVDDGAPEWLGRQPPSEHPPSMGAGAAGALLSAAGAPSSGLAPMRAPAATVPGVGPSSSAWVPRPPTPKPPPKKAPLADTSSLPQVSSPSPPPAKARTTSAPSEIIELLWFDADATKRLRKRWPKLCDELDFAPLDDKHDLITDDPEVARNHHIHFGLITEAELIGIRDLRSELRHAISETGRFSPPLVVLSGRLELPFEELEILRATAAAVAPIAGDDKKLKEALAQVKELLDTPLLSGSAETVTNFTRHLRQLYQQSKRKLSLEYLDETVERILLEQRRYQKRTLFGDEWIRALFSVKGSDKPLPAYLPTALEKKLPMLVSFNARVIAEAHVKQDQYEANPHAIKVVTLGRVIELAD